MTKAIQASLFFCARNFLVRDVSLHTQSSNYIMSIQSRITYPPLISMLDCVTGSRLMSTGGRSMRSKVEKRMQREAGKTLREMRRAKKLRKKLMTEDERLIYNLRRVSFFATEKSSHISWELTQLKSSRPCLVTLPFFFSPP